MANLKEQTITERNIESLTHENIFSFVTTGEEKLLKHVVTTLYNKGVSLEDIKARVTNAVACAK